MKVLRGHEGKVYSASFSSDGKRILTGSKDGTARIWDAASGRELKTLRGHAVGWRADEVSIAVFDTSGRIVASGSGDGAARIFDAHSGELIKEFKTDSLRINGLSFSPDGKILAAALDAGAVVLWHVDSGVELAKLVGHTSEVLSVSWSSDGGMVVTGGKDGIAQIWKTDWLYLRRHELRNRVCKDRLAGDEQFTRAELTDAVLQVVRIKGSTDQNPCLRLGPFSWNYWARLLPEFAKQLAGQSGVPMQSTPPSVRPPA
jgi:dipeptidyl aminopeptidase/acylaminoacyl peptidase